MGEPIVGRFDSFEGADGFSLAAVQVAARLSAATGFPIEAHHVLCGGPVWRLAHRLRQGVLRTAPGVVRSPSPPPAVPAPRSAGAPQPLSSAQASLWSGQQQNGDAGVAWHIPLAWRLQGPLDIARLRNSMQALAERHEALRTTVADTAEGPVQRILTAPSTAMDTRPASTPGPALENMGSWIEEAITGEATRPFAFDGLSALWRASLVPLAKDDHLLVIVLHHLIADGWSVGILARELGQFYAHHGAPHEALPPVTGYSAWVDAEAQGQACDTVAAQAHWRQVLAAPLAAFAFPCDRQPEPGAPARGDSVPLVLGLELRDRLRALQRRAGLSLFALLAGALLAQCHRHNGSCDARLAYPAARRTERRWENAIGCFIQTTLLRTRIDPAASLLTLAEQVSARLRGDGDHAGLPWEKLVAIAGSASEVSPGDATAPLAEVLLNLNPHDTPRLDLPGLHVTAVERLSRASPFPLGVIVSARDDAFGGRIEYDTRRYSRAQAETFATQFRRVLEALLDTPTRSVSRLPLLSEAERATALGLDHCGPIVANACILPSVAATFAEQCVRTPDATALHLDGRCLDFATLGARVAGVAQRLRTIGVGAEVPVVCCLPRGVDAVVAILATWVAGGVYVPLDIGWPAARIAAVLHELHGGCIFTTKGLAQRWPAHPAFPTLYIDAPPAAGSDDQAPDIVAEARVGEGPSGKAADRLAYVLYTSGTTGQPKGVAVGMQAFSRHVAHIQGRIGYTAADRVLQFANNTFDAALEQLVVPLCAGASVVLRGDEPWSPEETVAAIATNGITVADIPTAYWHQMAAAAEDPLAGAPLRLLIIGGEIALAQPAGRHARAFATLNAYGPTETTVTACLGEVTPQSVAGRHVVPVGHPMLGTRVYALDEALQPVPAGAEGELYVAGDRLARGYWHRPGLTAERFLPDPWGPPGQRMYRTGDRGRRLPDGAIEVLGRFDDQVKISGLRIELGEIEAALHRHADVVAAAVVVHSATPLERHLVAHLVLAPGVRTGEAALRQFLRELLPEAYLPHAWRFRDALPMTPNGKVDRPRLASEPSQAQPAGPDMAAAPAPTVARIAAHVSTLSPGRVPAAHEPLADHGFHSMLLVRLGARIKADFNITLTMRELIRARTIEALSALVDERSRSAATPSRP